MATIAIKRGDDFSKTCTFLKGSVPTDLTGSTVASQLRGRKGIFICDLTTALLVQDGLTLGKFTISATSAVTALWPLGVARFDVQVTGADGKRKSSATVSLRVVEDITQ